MAASMTAICRNCATATKLTWSATPVAPQSCRTLPQQLRTFTKPNNTRSANPHSLHYSDRRLLSTKGQGQQSNKTTPPNPGSEMKAIFNWKELGANRTTKIVILVALSIAGTVETIFWVKVIWHKFVGTQDSRVAEMEQLEAEGK